MRHTPPPSDLPLVVIRRLHSLREAHAELVQASLARSAPGWSVDRHDDYEGDLFLMITRNGEEGTSSYVLNADGDGVKLGRVEGDSFAAVGRFDTVATAVLRLEALLADEQNTSPLDVNETPNIGQRRATSTRA